MLTLFHGSSEVVKIPSLDKARPNNDYGVGFYCCDDYELAAQWACQHQTDGFVNTYSLNETNLNILNLMNGNYTVLNWIALLMANRKIHPKSDIARDIRDELINQFLPSLEGFDVVIGYRADDSYFAFAEDFINNELSVDALACALVTGNLGLQTVLISKKAFDSLVFVDAKQASSSIYYPKYKERDFLTRKTYAQTRREPKDYSSLFALDLLRNGVKNDDARIPRILCQ